MESSSNANTKNDSTDTQQTDERNLGNIATTKSLTSSSQQQHHDDDKRYSDSLRPSTIEILLHRKHNVMPLIDDAEDAIMLSSDWDSSDDNGGDDDDGGGGSGDRRRRSGKKGKRKRKHKRDERSRRDADHLHDWEWQDHSAGYGSSEHDVEDENDTAKQRLRRRQKRGDKRKIPTIPFLDTFFKTFSSRLSKTGGSSSGTLDSPVVDVSAEVPSPISIAPAAVVGSLVDDSVHVDALTQQQERRDDWQQSLPSYSPVLAADNTLELVDSDTVDATPRHRRSNSNASTTSSVVSVHSESDSSTITVAAGLKIVDRESTLKKRIEWGPAASIVDSINAAQRERQAQTGTVEPPDAAAVDISRVVSRNDAKLSERPLLKMFNDPSVYIPGQRSHVNDLPPDTIILTMSFLEMQCVLSCGAVCRLWKKLYRVNYLWAPFIVQKFGPSALRPPTIPKTVVQQESRRSSYVNLKRSDKKRTNRRTPATVVSPSTANGAVLPSTSQNGNHSRNNNADNRVHIYLYYTRYKYRMRRMKRIDQYRQEQEKIEQVRQHYEKVLRNPQKWCERFYISFYTPLFFILAFASLLAYALYLDGIIPRGYTTESSNWIMFLTISPYLLIASPLFFAGAFAAFAADFLKTLRWNSDFDSFSTMIFMGNMWIVIAPWLVIIKNFVLPSDTQWRAAVAPLWVVCFMFIVVSFIIHKKIDRVKFGLDQKITWVLTSIINVAVTITTGFIAGKLDGELSNLYYTSFVFSPIWAVLFIATASICIGGFVFLSEAGWKAMCYFYAPLSAAFVVPFIPFLFMLGLKIDNVATNLLYTIVLSPLLTWCVIWFAVSVVFGLIVFVRKKRTVPVNSSV